MKPDKKQQIIREATKLFLADGFAGVSMSDIVRAANVSKGGIYNYYSNKEDLFIDVVNNIISETIHIRQTVLLSREFASLKQLLEAYVDFVFSALQDKESSVYNVFMVFYEASRTSDQLSIRLREVHKEMIEVFAKYLEAAKKSGEIIESVDSHAIAEMLISLKEGVSVDFVIQLYDVRKARALLHAHYEMIYQLIERRS